MSGIFLQEFKKNCVELHVVFMMRKVEKWQNSKSFVGKNITFFTHTSFKHLVILRQNMIFVDNFY